MTTSTSGTHRRVRKAVAAGLLAAATAGGLTAAALPAAAAPSGKVTLCHATGSATNPYVRITISAAGAYNGHFRQHADLGGGDIIPPFTYRGETYSLNWTKAGRATVKDNCTPKTPPPNGGY